MTEEEGFWTLGLGNRQRYIASTSTRAATTVPSLDLEPVMRGAIAWQRNSALKEALKSHPAPAPE